MTESNPPEGMREAVEPIAAAICDGWHNGYKQFADCDAMEKMRFLAAARCVSALLASRPAAGVGERRLSDYQREWLDAVVNRLSNWREADHEDSIALSRSEVVTILDGLRAPTPAASPDHDKQFDAAWDAVLRCGELERARSRLSIHELRLIIRAAIAGKTEK